MGKQQLSPKAAADKKKRDLAFAKTPRRRAMKAENQRKRRAAKKAGQDVAGKDYDHNRGRFVSVKTNRSATKTTNNTMDKKSPIKSGGGKGIKKSPNPNSNFNPKRKTDKSTPLTPEARKRQAKRVKNLIETRRANDPSPMKKLKGGIMKNSKL